MYKIDNCRAYSVGTKLVAANNNKYKTVMYIYILSYVDILLAANNLNKISPLKKEELHRILYMM
jgi:hypothetical protein